MVRLVRACGSKLFNGVTKIPCLQVRLVRACGSKPAASRKMPSRISVRLVRACGSKPEIIIIVGLGITGQARKSLWIETLLQK